MAKIDITRLKNIDYVKAIYELLLDLKPSNSNLDLTNYYTKTEITNLLTQNSANNFKVISGYIVNDAPSNLTFEIKQNDFGNLLPYIQREPSSDAFFLELSPLFQINNEMAPSVFVDHYSRTQVLVSDASLLMQSFSNINSEALQIYLNTNGDYAKIFFEIKLFDSIPQ